MTTSINEESQSHLITCSNHEGNSKSNNLNYYLAGLIEGDGSIKIPKTVRSEKGKILYPSITIVFAAKDFPLAKFLANILNGTTNKAKGEYYVLSIYSIKNIYSLVNRINGKFRTPKIEALHRLINWLNEHTEFEPLDLLSLDKTNLNSNAWLAGFSDCDSNFLITFLEKNGIAKSIQLTFRLSQRQNYYTFSSLGISYLSVLTEIATLLSTKVTSFERNRFNKKSNYIEKGYLITVKSILARNNLIDYFSKYPLLSSKRLDYNDWLKAHKLIISKTYKDIEGTAKLIELKNSMNTKRYYFNWDHLNN